jgi:succinate dehydrogenase / fumarate reductase cytochrome b subunit
MSTAISEKGSRPFILTSIGKKYLMGISGLVWAGFVFGHMAGNMLIFVSPDLYNAYGHAIVSNKILLYGTEAVLLLALITHVLMAVILTKENRQARSQRYAVSPSGIKGASLASKTMAIQGSLILAFVISHLVTFKYGTYYETTVNGVVMRDLHRLIVEVFSQPGYLFWYVVCLVLLGFHLSHGMGSIFQSLGISHVHSDKIKKLSLTYAIVVALGFLSQPIYVFFIAG